jgi:hypothetical protein
MICGNVESNPMSYVLSFSLKQPQGLVEKVWIACRALSLVVLLRLANLLVQDATTIALAGCGIGIGIVFGSLSTAVARNF